MILSFEPSLLSGDRFLFILNRLEIYLARMEWLRRILSKNPAIAEVKKQQKAKKRHSKEHSRRVRQRERELRSAADAGGKRGFFWGSTGQPGTGGGGGM